MEEVNSKGCRVFLFSSKGRGEQPKFLVFSYSRGKALAFQNKNCKSQLNRSPGAMTSACFN